LEKRTNTAKWDTKRERWQINVQRDGQRRSFYSSTPGRAGQREANKRADEWLDAGLVDAGAKVERLYGEWIGELKKTTSQDHWRQYEGYGRNWIIPKIGNIKAGNLTEQHLQSIITQGFVKQLSRKTLCNMRACMTSFVKYLRKCKVSALLVENLAIPRGAKVGERTILQPDDLTILFSKDTTIARGKEVYELYINAYRFEVATGLRPGEVIGLQSADIMGARTNIKRSINRRGDETSGKNDNARRSFVLTSLSLGIIERQKAKLKELNIQSDYVFPNELGEPIKQATYYKRWVKYRAHAGIAEASPYELRHTFVSIIKELPEGYLKQLVGHSKAMDSYGTYSHEVNGDMEQAASLVQAMFAKALKARGEATGEVKKSEVC
jgi:integrase